MHAIVSSFADLRQREPKLRTRDAAHRLGVREAEVVAAGCLGATRRLRPDFREALRRFPSLGKVKAICRNEAAVHEKEGTFERPHFVEGGTFTLGEMDLRYFLDRWWSGFAVEEQLKEGVRRSLQFFDAHGDAILKLYPGEEAAEAFEAFVAALPFDADHEVIAARRAPRAPKEPQDVDVERLREAWLALRDTHEFFGMLKRLEVERTDALRVVGADLSASLGTQALEDLLRTAAAQELPIMVFVGNAGAIQIHTGPVRRIAMLDTWLNVLDPGFNLHLDTRLVHSVYRVRKPTRDGIVTSIECFDAEGEPIALFFGERKPGREELQAWRELVAGLEVRHA